MIVFLYVLDVGWSCPVLITDLAIYLLCIYCTIYILEHWTAKPLQYAGDKS